MAYTRRSHIVRIPDDPDTGNYIDVEVLDAISFKTTDGQDVILSMKAEASDPYIVDDTGGGHERKTSSGTSRSHMKRITSKTDPTQQLDVEVADIIALQDTNGRVWVLDMKATTGEGPSIFDSTDGNGDSKATRRGHSEKISVPYGSKDPTNKSYLTMQRCDNIAFRTINGHVVVLSSPSADDGSGQRAETYTTPQGYDPSDNSPSAVKPPMLKDTGDKRNYVKFVKDASGVFTGDEKIQMGPFWWIRKISGCPDYLLITVGATAQQNGSAPLPPSAGVSGEFFLDMSDPVTTQVFTPSQIITTSYFFIWTGGPPWPTADTVDLPLGFPPFGGPYGGQWPLTRKAGVGGWSAPLASLETGFFGSLADAEAAAAYVNGFIYAGPSPYYCSYWGPDGVLVENASFGGFSAGQVDVTTQGTGSGTSTMSQQFLFGPLPAGASSFSVNFGGSNSASVDAKLICANGKVTSLADFPGGVTLAGDSGGGAATGFGVDVFVGGKVDGSDSSVVVSFVASGGGAQ